VIALFLITICLGNLSNYIYFDTLADLQESTFGPEQPDGFVNRPPVPQLIWEGFYKVVPEAIRLPTYTILQNGFVLIELFLIWQFFRTREQPVLALVAPILWALHGRNYILAHTTQSEPLFIFLTMIWLAIAARWFAKRDWGSAIALGLILGLLPATKSIGLIAVVLVGMAYILSPGHGGIRMTTQLCLAYVMAFGIGVGFMAINEKRIGSFSIVDEKGLHLLSRIVSHGEQLPEKPASNQITEAAKASNTDLYQRDSLWAIRSYNIDQLGMTPFESDALMAKAAKEATLENPGQILWGNIVNLFDCTRRDDAVWSIPVGMDEDYYDEHGLYWSKLSQKEYDLYSQFPTVERTPRYGEMGYRIIHHAANEFPGAMWRGWWIPPALLVLGIACLFSRDPGFILCTGFAAGNLAVSVATEASQVRFWDASVLPFILAVCIALRYLYDWLRKIG